MNKIAIDTNILLYSIDKDDSRKLNIAVKLIENNPTIFSQNISEFMNVLLNKWKYPKAQLGLIVSEILDSCLLMSTSTRAYKNSFELIKKYDFQVFDSIIIASALEAGCTILYSEDMHNGLIIENQLEIINPFK